MFRPWAINKWNEQISAAGNTTTPKAGNGKKRGEENLQQQKTCRNILKFYYKNKESPAQSRFFYPVFASFLRIKGR